MTDTAAAIPRRDVTPDELAAALELIRVHGDVRAASAALRKPQLAVVPPRPAQAPPAPPAAVHAPVMPKTFREVIRAVELGIINAPEARYFYGLPTRRRRWWQ